MSDLDPDSYFDVELLGDLDFEVEFTVQEGTDIGVYDFQVCAAREEVIYAT